MVRDTHDGGTLSLLDLIEQVEKEDQAKKPVRYSNKPVPKPQPAYCNPSALQRIITPQALAVEKPMVADEAPTQRDIKKQKENPRWESLKEANPFVSIHGDSLEYYRAYINFIQWVGRYIKASPEHSGIIHDDDGGVSRHKALRYCKVVLSMYGNGSGVDLSEKPTIGDLEGAARILSVKCLSQKR